MKTKTKILFLYLTLPFLLFPMNSSLAWKNGSYAYTSTEYDYATDYGTHDWIADAALDALSAAATSSWSWLKDRVTIYLLGTEAPDNSGISITLDGTAVTGFGDTTWHHIYYNEDGTISNNEDDAALRAKACGDLADSYLEANKLDLAAFYLGAMAHYIGDLAMFSHCAPNNVPPHNLDFDTYHSTIEGYVLTRSDKNNDKEEFFKISSFTPANVTPYNAAKNLGWDTYKDPSPSEATTRDAPWLHNNHFTGWVLTYAARAVDTTTHQIYYSRIEQSLNNAIQAVASAMIYISGVESTPPDESTFPVYPLPILIAIMSIVAVGLIINVQKKKRQLSKF